MNEFGDTPRSARQRRKHFRHLLHKCLAPAFDVAASPTAQPQLQRHVRALDCKAEVASTPLVPVRSLFSAARANAGTSPNCSDNPTTADPVDTQNTNARPRRQPRFCLHPAGYRPRRSRSRRPVSTRFEAEPPGLGDRDGPRDRLGTGRKGWKRAGRNAIGSGISDDDQPNAPGQKRSFRDA